MIRQAKVIVIDEISMVRSDVFCAVDYRLRQLALGKNNKQRPFGGKQVIVVGDFFQLPPVVKKDAEEDYLKNTFGGIYAFQTKVWQSAGFKTVFLRTIHRQQGETTFVNILNNIRHNNLEERNIILPNGYMATTLEALNAYCTGKPIQQPSPVILCTTNREAESYNVLCQNRLTAKQQLFKAVVVGTFNEKDYPTQAILTLQEGARVMILVNKRTPDGVFEYVNGDTGVITAMNSGTMIVTVKLDSGRICDISPNTWIQYEYVLEKDRMSGGQVLRQREAGKFTQMPLKLAYAITIHKSQGMSLERVYVKLGNGCFAHGQLYTALSRCRFLKTLQLERHLFAEDVIVDQAVADFYETLEQPTKSGNRVSLSVPQEYEAQMLAYLSQLQAKKIPLKAPVEENPVQKPGSVIDVPKTAGHGNVCFHHTDIDHLITVYRNQTWDEHGAAMYKNSKGFNKVDAPILTMLAEDYLAKGFLTEDELKTVSRRIKKYHAQFEEQQPKDDENILFSPPE
jgi:hypothetical protein